MTSTHKSSPQHTQKKRIGVSAQEMPHPKAISEHVYRFTAGRSRALNSEVVDYTGKVAYRFVTEGKRMTMYDAADGREIASVLWGMQSRVTWEGVETKLKNFVFKNNGNTGPLFTHDGNLYEWLQDMFYATVRTSPGAVRMAVIYNDKEKPEVELTPEGQAEGSGLLEQILFMTVLFECELWKDRGLTLIGAPNRKKILAAAGVPRDHEDRMRTPALAVDTKA